MIANDEEKRKHLRQIEYSEEREGCSLLANLSFYQDALEALSIEAGKLKSKSDLPVE